MRTRKLGRTGLDVSALCLECMTYGIPERGPHPWTLSEADSRPLLKQALDLGFDAKPGRLDDAVAAFDLWLTDDEIAAPKEPYVPHAPVGFS